MISAAAVIALQASLGLLDEGDCAPDRAAAVSIEQVNADPAAFDGRCVTVEGFAAPWAVYTSREALDLAMRALRGEMPVGRIDQRLQIGTYFPDMEEPRFDDYGMRWTITGKLHLCRRVSREVQDRIDARREPPGEEDGISMVFIPGYCHYFQGPAIVVVEAQRQRPPFEARFEEGEVPPRRAPPQEE